MFYCCFFKQKTAYEMRISDWSSDVCSSDLSHQETFDPTNYRDKFDAFVKRYPIIGSSTHSIVNSIKSGAILDYAIIDEASQQDIIPGILALGCVDRKRVV